FAMNLNDGFQLNHKYSLAPPQVLSNNIAQSTTIASANRISRIQ
ncbi:unnamed protein product, partial [Rotaria sp. Silwood1]